MKGWRCGWFPPRTERKYLSCVGVRNAKPRNRRCMNASRNVSKKVTKDRCELRQTSAEIGRRGAARRTASGTKHTCGTAVRCARRGECSGVHTTALDEGGELAGVG